MRLARHLFLAAAAVAPVAAHADSYLQTNLVSDVAGLAATTDSSLKNPWGIAYGPTGPFWVSNQGTNSSTLYTGTGAKVPLTVMIPTTPGNAPPQGPTGQVFNGDSTAFKLGNGNSAAFLFANLNGTISGWNGGPAAQITATVAGAVFTGLASGTSALGSTLYAADNASGKIDVFNSSFAGVTLAGKFVDSNLPTGMNAFNIQNLGGTLYVTYAFANGPGGVVDTFDLNGNFKSRLITDLTSGPLDQAWGVALAPSTFGRFSNALLVGNNNSIGQINAFDATTGAFLGEVDDAAGHSLGGGGLWGLTFGNGGRGGDPSTLYFAAGINGEQDGLFGSIRSVPEPGSIVMVGLGLGAIGLIARRRTSARA